MSGIAKRCLAWGVPVLMGGLVACAGGSSQIDRDPRNGTFYTNDEVMALSKGARDAYCNELEDYLEELRAETAEYNGRLDSMEVMADSLRTKTIELSAQIRETNAELRELRLRRKTVKEYTIKDGDSLREIAKLLYGDPNRWRDIYKANESSIGAEDAELKAGSRLTIPR